MAEAPAKFMKDNLDVIGINENDELVIKSSDLAECIRKIAVEEDIFTKAITKYGAEAQEGVAQEECAELIQAISKKHRGKSHNIDEEIADVEIMIAQLKIINNCWKEVDEIKQKKIQRLRFQLQGVINDD